MAKENKKLFDMFPPVTTEEWMAKITADLKGADFNKKLVWKTNEGFNVQPFYRREDIKDLTAIDTLPGQFPYLRGTRDNNDWLIRQQVLGNNAEEMNKHAREILTKGVESLGISLFDEFTPEDLKTVLKDIDLKKVEVNVSCCPRKAVEMAKVLVELINAQQAANDFRGSIDFNPFRGLLLKGKKFPKDIKETAVELYNVVKPVAGLRCFPVNSYMFNNCGAFIYQELGYALTWGAEWMTLLTDAGLSPCEVALRVIFNMGIGSNYFMEIAKFRAGRMLWAEIVKAYGANPENCDCCKMKVHAVTSRFNMTIYDAHVNLLRSMTESMSAALAGVDSIETLPFDLPYKNPDDFSERIARNQQVLLRDESHLDKVVDPAGGSYYIETLTASIAEQAWKLFNEVEDAGGFYELLSKGEIQGKVNESGVKRHVDVARRKEILLGTNQYPNVNEKALDKIENTTHVAVPAQQANRKMALYSGLILTGQQASSNNFVSTLNAAPIARKSSCSLSAILPCVLQEHSSQATSSDAQDMRLSTTSDSTQLRMVSRLLLRKRRTLWFSARAMMNMPSMLPKRSRRSTARLSS